MTTVTKSRAAARPAARRPHHLVRKPGVVVCVAVLVLLIAAAILAPVIAPYPYAEQDYTAISSGITPAHWLGTDEYGRDVFSRLLYGAQVSLVTAAGSVSIALVVGVALGMVAATVGGGLDAVIMRLTDTVLAFPTVLLALSITAAVGRSTWGVIVAIAVVITPSFIRMMRIQVLSIRERLYVRSAKTFGAPAWWIMLRHILPNAFAPVLVLVTQYLAIAMLIEAGLNFLGLGTPAPFPSWGQMLRDAAREMAGITPQVLAPGIAITLAVLSVNVIGDWIRDVWDPRSAS